MLAVATFASVVACSRSASPSIEAGRALYADNGCASCHGTLGHGDGPIAATLDLKPRDFRVRDAYKVGADTASIAWVIANGLAVGGKMPPFPHLSAGERQSLALFIVSLQRTTPDTGPRP